MKLKMVTVKHISTQQLTNDTTRLIFEIDALNFIKYHGELILELRWFFSTIWKGSVAEYNCPIENKQRFQVDIPAQNGLRWRSFRWVLSAGIVFNGRESHYKGKGKRIRILSLAKLKRKLSLSVRLLPYNSMLRTHSSEKNANTL